MTTLDATNNPEWSVLVVASHLEIFLLFTRSTGIVSLLIRLFGQFAIWALVSQIVVDWAHKTLPTAACDIVAEEYNKWFQSEENDIYKVLGMMREVKENLKNIESLSPQELWETIRTLAYINHSAFKVRPGTWDLYPDEMLEPNDFRLNKLVYAFKTKALDVIIDYYLENDLPISTNENSSIIILRVCAFRSSGYLIGKVASQQ